MINHRIVERPAFEVAGKKTWISGQDNELFGRFWERCQAEGLFQVFQHLRGSQPGPQTNGSVLGVSCVEQDPANRAFYYMIAIETPASAIPSDLERYQVPACQWAVFESKGKMPDALVASEMYAFTQWLPTSGFVHAHAPEMEVYPPGGSEQDGDVCCEFWLPIAVKA